MPSITLTISSDLQKASSTASELLFGVLARALNDGLGPVRLPSICLAAARELVALGMAQESLGGCFEIRPEQVQLGELDSTLASRPAAVSSIAPIALEKASPAATELFLSVLARTAVDRLGPVLLPTICRKAGRELVALGLASEGAIGCFELCQATMSYHHPRSRCLA